MFVMVYQKVEKKSVCFWPQTVGPKKGDPNGFSVRSSHRTLVCGKPYCTAPWERTYTGGRLNKTGLQSPCSSVVRALVLWARSHRFEPGLEQNAFSFQWSLYSFCFSDGLIFIVKKQSLAVIRPYVFGKIILIDNCKQIVAYQSYISPDHNITVKLYSFESMRCF